MKELIKRVTEAVSKDPGDRGLLAALETQGAEEAARLILGAQRLMILTGFPILASGTGENDGPIGAASIARASLLTGGSVCLVTDKYSSLAAERCLEAAGAGACPVICMPIPCGEAELDTLLERGRPDLIVAIERPGKGSDGHFHSMRGAELDHMTADFDSLLRRGIPSICIGDGGNELGMGNFAPLVKKHVLHGETIASAEKCTVPLAAGISNWWGWGLAAVMSAMTERDLMTSAHMETACLRACMEANAVDGVLGRAAMSVDGVPMGGADTVHRELRTLLDGFLSRGKNNY